MECKYCRNIFKTKYILQCHQKRAKYCLAIQKNTNVQYTNTLYTCEFCSKQMAQDTKSRHLQSCRSKKDNETKNLINNLQQELNVCKEELRAVKQKLAISNDQLTFYKDQCNHSREVVEEIAKQPRTTTQNTQNILLNMSPLDMSKEGFCKAIQDSFTKDYFLDGQKGVAKFAVDNLLKDEDGNLMYVCTDPSRQIYRFKTLEGDLERDVRAKKLTAALAEELLRKSQSLASESMDNGDSDVFLIMTTNYQDIRELDQDNGRFRNELASLTTMK